MFAKRVSHYELGDKLGQGGMGEVFRARDTKLGREVALKFVPESLSGNPDALERFRREARTASSLNHPNICTIYEIDEADGRQFISMELLEGRSLKERLSDTPLPADEIIGIGTQVADALAAAHRRGVTHRDIKPANIFLTEHGEAKILDFGLAKVQSQSDAAETDLTSAGTTVGTVAYMSPEQARGEEVDGRSDLFSLGVVLYEMATGKLPHPGSAAALVYDAILHKEPESVQRLNPAVPPGLAQIIRKALAKERADRHQSAQELLGDLRQLSQSVRTVGPRRVAWGRIAAAATLLLAVVVGLPLLWHTLQRPRAVEPRRLAVVPFAFRGTSASHQMMCDALVEIITNHLTQLDPVRNALAVIPASDIRRQKVTSPEEARARFGVSLAITGTAISEPAGMRLLLELVDTTTPNRPRQLESRDLRGTASLEDDSIAQISEMLHLTVRPGEFNLLAASRSRIPDATSLYLEGRGNLLHYDMPGKTDRAIELFNQAAARDPAYALAYAGLGEAYWRKYDASKDVLWLDQAQRNGDRALELDKGLAAVHVSRGLIDAGRGRYEAAVADYERALKLEPRSYEALQGLAVAYERLNKLDLAEQTFRKAILQRPDLWTCHNLLGSFFMRHGRYEDAANQYRQGLQQAPGSPWLYNNLGAANLYLGRPGEAATMFEKADQIAPDYNARSNLGRIYFDLGRYEDAARSFTGALELNPRSRALMGNLASAYYWSGEREKARDAYRSAVQLTEAELKVNPNDAGNLAQLAVYHTMLGERGPALSAISKALKLAPAETNVLYNAAYVYERIGNRDEALKWLARALQAGYSLEMLERSPGMQQLRADPRYVQLAQDASHKKKSQ